MARTITVAVRWNCVRRLDAHEVVSGELTGKTSDRQFELHFIGSLRASGRLPDFGRSRIFVKTTRKPHEYCVSFRFRRFLDLSFSRIYTKPVCVEMYGKTPAWSVLWLMQVGFRNEPILGFCFCRRNTCEARVVTLRFQLCEARGSDTLKFWAFPGR